jgi:predicted membrane-bound spermidine synthase/Flp pilus assembly protein TadD
MQAEVSETAVDVSPSSATPVSVVGFTVLLVLSGFCGISYEVLYGRVLSNFIGDQFAVSASILLTFLLGMGLGSLYAHRWARWLWAIEAGIGFCGVALTLGAHSVENWFYASAFAGRGLGGAMAVCFLILAIPSFLIGCSLPLFAGYLARLTSGHVFARAYAAYNFGAALTVLMIEFLLLRTFGIRNTVLVIAAINGLVAICVFLRFGHSRTQLEKTISRSPLPRRTVAALALASVASAVFQLLMLKIAECFLGPFRQTFAIVLTVVLLGLAIGSAIQRRLRLQFSTLLLITIAGLAWLLAGFEIVAWSYASIHPRMVPDRLAIVTHNVLSVFLLMGIPAIGFGALVPALLDKLGDVARKSGRLLFVSSTANAAGFLLMAFALHRWLDYGIILLVIAFMTGAAVIVYRGWRHRASTWAIGLAIVTVVFHQARWDEQLLYIGFDGFQSRGDFIGARSYLRFPERFKGNQDVFSINHVKGDEHFFINGYISIAMNSPSEKIVGAFPPMFAPRTDRALVLGVGSAATAGTLAVLVDHLDAVEINPVVLQNLHRMAEHNFNIMARTNVHFILDDGIHYTRVCTQTYPLIINTVTGPLYFSSSKLYTVDFLQAVRRCLDPDGIYVTWIDARVGERGLDTILKTIAQTPFQHCALAAIRSSYYLLLCSDQPIRLRRPELVNQHPEADSYFRKQGVLPEYLPYGLLNTRAFDLIVDSTVPVNTFDYPALEFEMTRLDQKSLDSFGSKLEQTLGLENIAAALEPALKMDLIGLALHTERLYDEDSALSRNRLKRVNEARDDFREVYRPAKLEFYRQVASTANSARAHHEYARQLLLQKKFAESIDQEEQALALDPTCNNAYLTLALAQEQSGQFEAARSNYLNELRVDPAEHRVTLALGRLAFKTKDYTNALTLLERASREDDYFENHLYLSQTLEALGRTNEAEVEFEKSLHVGAKPSPRRGLWDRLASP